MRKLSIILLILSSGIIYAQDKIELGKFQYVPNGFNGYEVSLTLKKPNDKFNLIELDTILVTDNKGRELIEVSRISDNYRKGANRLRHYQNKKNFKYVNIKGVMKYFQPSKSKKSHFVLGEFANLEKEKNLIPKEVLAKDSTLYFGFFDIDLMQKKLPKITIEGKPLDFSKVELIYAVSFPENKKIVGVFNNEIAPHPFMSVTRITNRKEKRTYHICSRYDYTKIESDKLNKMNVELMIENKESITQIPFEFKKVEIEK